MKTTAWIALLLCPLVSGCLGWPYGHSDGAKIYPEVVPEVVVVEVPKTVHTDVLYMAYNAVDELLEYHSDRQDIDRVLFTTIVELNSFTETSTFGRLLSEFLTSRMTQHDYDVILVTLRDDALKVNDEGQFLLSREIKNLAADHNARTALVGTYTVADQHVFISLRLVSTVENAILSAVDRVVPIDNVIRDLLAKPVALYPNLRFVVDVDGTSLEEK